MTFHIVCEITECYLAREFKSYTGQTVMTYLNMVRCKNAEICLAEGKSVTETAYECGFESISCFSRTYKKSWVYHHQNLRKNDK
ncbi:MAG: helix-turn-helix domain-containing protein [Clostridia bacterium]|nr:helix-turn-helix domain-containing protein [Clostridia bacterium]